MEAGEVDGRAQYLFALIFTFIVSRARVLHFILNFTLHTKIYEDASFRPQGTRGKASHFTSMS